MSVARHVVQSLIGTLLEHVAVICVFSCSEPHAGPTETSNVRGVTRPSYAYPAVTIIGGVWSEKRSATSALLWRGHMVSGLGTIVRMAINVIKGYRHAGTQRVLCFFFSFSFSLVHRLVMIKRVSISNHCLPLFQLTSRFIPVYGEVLLLLIDKAEGCVWI